MNSKINYNNAIYFFTLVHIIVWTLIPTVFHPNMPLDMTELVSWGHEWQLGYEKHPPLSSWIAEAAMQLNKSVSVFFLLSQLSIAATIIIVFRLGLKFLKSQQAFMAAILLEGIYYYNFTSPEFNPNVLMLPLWAGIALALWNALTTNRYRYWVLVGLLAALALLTKYYTAMLLISIGLMLTCIKDYRKFLKMPGPYLAFSIFIIMMLPHLLWMFNSHFTTINYVVKRSSSDYHFYNHILHPLKFSLAQALALLPAVIIFLLTNYLAKTKLTFIKVRSNEFWFLFFVGLMPFLITILISVTSGIRLRSMWGTPLWNLSGIMLFYYLSANNFGVSFSKYYYRMIALIMTISALAYTGAHIFGNHDRAEFNGEFAAKEITNIWQQLYPDAPLKIAVGDLWLAGNIAFYAEDRMSVFTDMDEAKAPWLNLATLKQYGGVIIWNVSEDGSNIPIRYNKGILELDLLFHKPLIVPWHNRFGKQKEPYLLGVVFIPPSETTTYYKDSM